MFDFWQVMRLMGEQTAAEVGWSDKEEKVTHFWVITLQLSTTI